MQKLLVLLRNHLPRVFVTNNKTLILVKKENRKKNEGIR